MSKIVKVNKTITLKFEDRKINQTFKNYIEFLLDGETINSNYMMLMEKCFLNDDETINVDRCSYAYIEIYDGNE